MVTKMSQAIVKAKKRMGLVETFFLSRSRLGVTTAMRILSDALGREGKYYAMELNTTGARGGPLLYALRIGNSPFLPHGAIIRPDHVVLSDPAKLTEREPKSEEVLFNFPTGLLIVNTKLAPDEIVCDYSFDGDLITVDITEIAGSMTDQKLAPPGVALMGFYAGVTQLVSIDNLCGAVEDYFTHHGLHAYLKDKLVPANLQGIRRAYNLGRSAKRVHFRGTGTKVKYYAYEDFAEVVEQGTSAPRIIVPTYQSGENPFIYRTHAPIWIDSKCERCDVCWSWLFCPDHNLEIVRPGQRGQPYDVRIDYSYCQGCHICEAECTCGAIQLRPQEEVVGTF